MLANASPDKRAKKGLSVSGNFGDYPVPFSLPSPGSKRVKVYDHLQEIEDNLAHGLDGEHHSWFLSWQALGIDACCSYILWHKVLRFFRDMISRNSDSGLVLGNNPQRLDITTATLPITFGAAFMSQVGGSPAVLSVGDNFDWEGRRFYPTETRSA